MLASSTAAVEKEQSTVAEVGEIAEHPADTLAKGPYMAKSTSKVPPK